MAMVNGTPLYMAELHDLLLQGFGLEMAQQLVATEMVRQEFARQQLTLSEDDVLAENDRTLREVVGEDYTPDQRDSILRQIQEKKRVPREHWDVTIRRNAMLRKLAEQRVHITDADLRTEYGDQYGRRVVVRHIQVSTQHEAQQMLGELRRGADFATLAKRYSRHPTTAKEGGLLPPIGPLSPPEIPDILRREALAMQAPGDLAGPILTGSVFHVLRLEQVIGAQAADFEQVRADLTETLRQRQITLLAERIWADLYSQATITFVDPTLREKARSESAP